jgi:hypothetical protein
VPWVCGARGEGTVLWGWFRDIRSFLADSSTSGTLGWFRDAARCASCSSTSRTVPRELLLNQRRCYQVAPESVETATASPLHSHRLGPCCANVTPAGAVRAASQPTAVGEPPTGSD